MPRSPDLPPLPTPLTRFFGRTQETAEACAKLSSGQTRLLTIVGPGGVGKTRLGLQVAARLQSRFADGVLFVPLSAVDDPALLYSTLVLALGIEGEIGADPAAQLRTFLQPREMLLLLDNFEQIVAAGPALGSLLVDCSRLSALVTSRVQLRVAGEHNYPLAPFPIPQVPAEGIDMDSVTESTAIALFVDRAQAADPTFAITPSTVRDVAEICRRSDGLPLAIELAVARLRVLTPGELAMRLEPRLPLLTGGPRDQPDRLRAMRNAIAWSYDLLGTQQQALFRRLSVFTGGFGISAVEQMAEDLPHGRAIDLLDELIDATLVQRTAGSVHASRFTMLETIREFGLEALSAAGEEDAARNAHAAWCIAFAEHAGPELAGPDHVTWWQHIETELPNIRQAHAWLARQRDAERALQLGTALGWFWASAGYYGEGRALYRQLATLPNAGQFPALLASVLSIAANQEHWLDNVHEATSLYQRALALYRELPDQVGIVSTLRALGSVAIDRDDLETASQYLAEAQALATTPAAAWDAAAIANLLSIVAFARGEYAVAATRSEEALRGWRSLDDTGHVGAAQVNLARATLAMGRVSQAATLLGQVLSTVQAEVGDDSITSDCFDVAAGLGLALGDARRSLGLLAAAEAMLARLGISRRPPFAAAAEQCAGRARGRLGDRNATDAWQQGTSLQLEAALDLAHAVVAAAAENPPSSPEVPGIMALTQREREVLRLVADGLSDKEIAIALGIARYTASNHVANIRVKLGAPSRAAIAAVAVRDGLA